MTEQTTRVLYRAQDVTSHDLVVAVNTVDDWFADSPGIPEDEFWDRLCDGADFDVELASPAARKILRHARQAWRDCQ